MYPALITLCCVVARGEALPSNDVVGADYLIASEVIYREEVRFSLLNYTQDL